MSSNFCINRAGRTLPRRRLDVLEKSKQELHALDGRPRKPPR